MSDEDDPVVQGLRTELAARRAYEMLEALGYEAVVFVTNAKHHTLLFNDGDYVGLAALRASIDDIFKRVGLVPRDNITLKDSEIRVVDRNKEKAQG